MPEFIVAANGELWAGWKSISVTRSLENAADEFELSLTSNNARDAQRALDAGAEVTLSLDNELLSTGYIDELAPEYDAESIELLVRGRSKLGDLVDCSTKGKQFKNQTFLNVATRLCSPFGVDVVVAHGVNANKALRQPSIDEGQTIWEFLEREARALALRLMNTPQGNLLITNAGTDAADRLVLGDNIRQASATFNHAERFSDYTVMASQSRSNPLLGASAININKGVSRDDAVKRHRPLVILSDDDLNTRACQQRAQWQRNTHFGRSQQVVYTVAGWQQSNGKTWQPNTLTVVDDGVAGINGSRLIIEVRLILDEQGARTELLVMPPEYVELAELPRVKKTVGIFG